MERNKTDIKSAVDEFLAELTELSRKHHIGLAGKPVVILMEEFDHQRTYRMDDNSRLSFEI